MTEDEPINGFSDSIWFREASNGEKRGPFSLALVSRWYEDRQLLPSVQLSADDGKQWSSIVNLRRLNGLVFPFCSFDNKQPSGMGSIEIAREMVSSGRSEIDRLESYMETIVEQLKEEERVLENLREMEKTLDPDLIAEIADRNGEETKKESEILIPSLVFSEISPPPGVDRFALLKLCFGATRKLEGDIENRLKQLNDRYNRCDKKQLEKRSRALFYVTKRECSLCNAKIPSIHSFMPHISSSKHIRAMKGVVCADAFDFWLNAVEMVTVTLNEPDILSEPVIGARPAPESGSQSEQQCVDEGSQPIFPSALPRNSIMRVTVDTPYSLSPREELVMMRKISSEKKQLDNDPMTAGLFVEEEVKALTGAGPTTQAATAAAAEATGDDELEEAIRRSLEDQGGPSLSSTPPRELSSYEEDLRRAMEMSMEDESEERSFQMVLAMSMEADLPSVSSTISGSSSAATAAPATPETAAEVMRAKREAFLKRFD